MSKRSRGFTLIPNEMRRCPAWCVLSLAARRVLDLMEIELGDKRGKTNGHVCVTHKDFCRYGIGNNNISPALRELEALGFIEVTQRGAGGNADHHRPNLYRITYLASGENQNISPTNEWEAISSLGEAKTIAARARAGSSSQSQKCRNSRSPKYTNSRSPKYKKPPPEPASGEVHFPPPEPASPGPNSPPPEPASQVYTSSQVYRGGRGEGKAMADAGPPADEAPRRIWTTPISVEVTDPDEVARMRAAFPDDPATDDASCSGWVGSYLSWSAQALQMCS
jgi:DNA-binding PadR family transcriptional regulator